MVHAFWTCYLVHSHIWTHWHTLMNLSMPSRGQGISPVLSFTISSRRNVAVSMSCAMRPSVWLISWLHHWRKLQLLIVKIIGFFTSVSFSMSRNFLFEIYCSWTLSVIMSKWSSIRWNAYVNSIVIVLVLSWRNHMSTHIKTDVLRTVVWICWRLTRMIIALVHYSHRVVYRLMLFAVGVHPTTVQTFVHNLSLMCKLSRIWSLTRHHLLLSILHILN